MLKVADRAQELTSAAGSGAILLQGAVPGFRSMSQAFSTGDTIPYVITLGSIYEVGVGTLTEGTPWSMSRDNIIISSNGDQLIDVTEGMFIFVDTTATFFENFTATGAFTWKGGLTSTPTSASDGWIYRDTTENKTYIYNNNAWEIFAASLPFSWPGTVTETEIGYLGGLTSNIQTQLGNIAAALTAINGG